MLDIEAFTYLNRALESTISPHVILATNRGLTTIRGTENEVGSRSSGGDGIVSPHGIPIDLLDRCMIVRTLPYNREEIRTVLGLRLKVEGLTIKDDALEKLADDGVKTSLRCDLHSYFRHCRLLTVSTISDMRYNFSRLHQFYPNWLGGLTLRLKT